MKVRKRNPKRSGGGAATSYATSFRSQATDPNIPEQSPERQMMEDKFLTYDHTKPDENENQKKYIEQRVWAHRMNKNTGEKESLHPNSAYGSTRKAGGTYKASVLDYLNQKPATPLSAGDILKLEELARTARSNSGKDKGNDWRPPNGLMGNSPPDGNPLDAVLERDDYILQNGGVPPPARPPPLRSQYNNPHDFNDEVHQYQHQQRLNNNSNHNTSTATMNSIATNNNNNTTNDSHHRHKSSQDYPSYQTRRSSDDSYRLASSPDNSENPLIASAAALSVEYNIKQQASSLPTPSPQRPPQPQHHYPHTYPTSITSSTSSQTLQEFSSKSMVTINTSNNNTRPHPARVSSIPRIHHSNPLPPPTSLPPPIPSELPPLPKSYIQS